MKIPACFAVALMATATPALAVITFTTDESNTLIGNFSYDVAGPGAGLGEGLVVGNFDHFDIIPADGTMNTFLSIDIDGSSNFRTYGEDDAFPSLTIAVEVFDSSGVQPIMYGDRNGTFESGFDSSTIAYSYTNIEYSSNTFSGNFSFTQVPEPSTALLGLAGGLFFLRRRR